jgi:hypothetical protein
MLPNITQQVDQPGSQVWLDYNFHSFLPQQHHVLSHSLVSAINLISENISHIRLLPPLRLFSQNRFPEERL